MAEYLDKTGLNRLWMKIKDYIANNAVVPSDITGNAATATKLKTARAIDGVTFDGSLRCMQHRRRNEGKDG